MDGKQIKILVVEDDNEINKLLCEIITNNGYYPQPAYSGTEALLYLEREQEWSMVLLDLMLPGLSGEEILQRLGQDRQVPVIAISASLSLIFSKPYGVTLSLETTTPLMCI